MPRLDDIAVPPAAVPAPTASSAAGGLVLLGWSHLPGATLACCIIHILHNDQARTAGVTRHHVR